MLSWCARSGFHACTSRGTLRLFSPQPCSRARSCTEAIMGWSELILFHMWNASPVWTKVSRGSVHPLCFLSQGVMMWPHMTLPAVSGPPAARHALALLWPPRLCPLCLQLSLLKTWQKASFTASFTKLCVV